MSNLLIEIRKRPKVISGFCITNGLWAVKLLPSIANPALKQYGDYFPPLYGVIVAVTFISVIGIWHMRKWGVNMYIIAFFLKELFLLSVNDISYTGIVLSGISITIFLTFYKRMSNEL